MPGINPIMVNSHGFLFNYTTVGLTFHISLVALFCWYYCLFVSLFVCFILSCLKNYRLWGTNLAGKIWIASTAVNYAAIGLLRVAPIVSGGFVFGPFFMVFLFS